MRYNPYDHYVVVFGDGGSGKSKFLDWILHTLPPNVVFWLWDYNRQHRYARTVRNIANLGYERTVIWPDDASEGEFIKVIETANRIGNIVVAIEEVQEYVTPHKLIGESFFRTGRNRGATWIALTQRPREVHKAIISNAHHRIIYRLTDPDDRKHLQKWIHPELDKVRELPAFHYYYHTKLEANPPKLCSPVPLVTTI